MVCFDYLPALSVPEFVVGTPIFGLSLPTLIVLAFFGTEQLLVRLFEDASRICEPMLFGRIGMISWICPNAPCRGLGHVQPTTHNERCLKHLLRYLRGTLDYKYLIKSDYALPHDEVKFTINIYADADWAGCATTRKSTTGVIVQLLNSTIHHYSKTQSILATSSGES